MRYLSNSDKRVSPWLSVLLSLGAKGSTMARRTLVVLMQMSWVGLVQSNPLSQFRDNMRRVPASGRMATRAALAAMLRGPRFARAPHDEV